MNDQNAMVVVDAPELSTIEKSKAIAQDIVRLIVAGKVPCVTINY